MRRNLILTVAATVTMVLLAMLVPLAVLVRSYALEDRLSRAALEVQATETVVSGQDKGAVAQYVERINRGTGITTTVFYPDGTAIGPDPEPDARIAQARRTGQARLDDVPGGSQIVVPVSQGGSSALPSQTPVIRVIVEEPGIGSVVGVAWGLLALLAVALLAGSLVVVDRLGRSFVQPIRQLAEHTQTLGRPGANASPTSVSGPPEVQELAGAVDRLVGRIQLLLARERENVADLSHRLRTPVTALRLRVDGASVPLWPVPRPEITDRTVLAGEAHGRWLWVVVTPAEAVLGLVGRASLGDASTLGPELLAVGFGPALPEE